MDEEFSISLVCLFCSEPLEAEENSEFDSDDLIDCKACGESNLYESLLAVAIEKAEQIVADQVIDNVNKTIGKIFK